MKNIFRHKNVLIVGLKKSGQGSLFLLKKCEAFCYVYDDDIKLAEKINDNDVVILSEIDEQILKIIDYMIISPGVSIYSEYVKLAELYGVIVIGEVELASYFSRGKIISITGTNGKTTTCTLLHHIFDKAMISNVLCGNIGDPFSLNLLPYKTNYILETSSFQLECVKRFKPNISAILNISPNHLDRHLTYKNYINAKFNIFKNSSKKDYLILNYDDELLRKLDERKLKCHVIYVSLKKEINGLFVKNNDIYYKNNKKIKKLVKLSNILLIGNHNIYNILFAVAISIIYKIRCSVIQKAIESFNPLPHRLQFVKNVNGVDYINDSKSTTPDSTIAALNSFRKKPIILILGGSSKKASFVKLARTISRQKNIKYVVLCGETAKIIANSLKKHRFFKYFLANSFIDALSLATKTAEKGYTILLSPACASFDFFNSFEERGEKFIEYVKELAK